MNRLYSTDGLVADLAALVGAKPGVTAFDDHHILTLGQRRILVATDDKGDWICRDLAKPHWHMDHAVLHRHFVENLAALLRGEKACMECPDDFGNTAAPP